MTPYHDETGPIPEGPEQEAPLYAHMPSWLLLEALLFLIPNVVWQLFTRRLGCPLSVISSRVQDLLSFTSQDVTNKALKEIASLIRGYCIRNTRSKKSSYTFFCCYGKLLCIGYLFLMVMHTANVIAQFFVLSSLLEIPYYRYGFEVLTAKQQLKLNKGGNESLYGIDSLVHTTYTEPISFPKVVLCDIQVRRLGNIHRYTAQCILPMSDFNASLLLFIWFFLFGIACLTIIGTVIFLSEILCGGCIGHDVTALVSGDNEKRFRHDNPTRGDNRHATMQMKEFQSMFLGRDCLFLLQTISENAGSVITEWVIVELWRSYHGDQSGNHWQMEEHATREAVVDSMHCRFHAGASTGDMARGQDVELLPIVATPERHNFNHDPPAYDKATIPQAATP